jgi:pimeloyl-ACP methyl ester carboxylesterase
MPSRNGGVTASHRGGSGEPLVLLHGINGSWRIWRPVIASLEADHDVFVPTLPGHLGGPALDPVLPVSIDALADGVEQSIEAAGLQTAHFAGNSLGGWLAIELARRGRARSVVAFSPAGGWLTDRDLRRVILLLSGARALLARREALRLDGLIRRPGFRRLAFRQAMQRGDLIPALDALELVAAADGCNAYDGFVRWIRGTQPIAAFPDGLPCHVRIAWGDHDRTIPFRRYGRPVLDALAGAEHVAVRGVGHVPMYDDPQLVVKTILEVTQLKEREQELED